MLKLGRVTKVKVFFLVLVYVFNFDLKGLLNIRTAKKAWFFSIVVQQKILEIYSVSLLDR